MEDRRGNGERPRQDGEPLKHRGAQEGPDRPLLRARNPTIAVDEGMTCGQCVARAVLKGRILEHVGQEHEPHQPVAEAGSGDRAQHQVAGADGRGRHDHARAQAFQPREHG